VARGCGRIRSRIRASPPPRRRRRRRRPRSRVNATPGAPGNRAFPCSVPLLPPSPSPHSLRAIGGDRRAKLVSRRGELIVARTENPLRLVHARGTVGRVGAKGEVGNNKKRGWREKETSREERSDGGRTRGQGEEKEDTAGNTRE